MYRTLGIMLSEINQTEKDKSCVISPVYGIYKKEKPNQTHRKRDQTCGCETQKMEMRRIGGR